MGLEVGEPFGLDASLGMTDALCGMEETLDREHNLVDTLLEGRHDIFVDEGFPSLICDDVIPNFLEHSHDSTLCSPPSLSSPKLAFEVPISISELCDANVDLGHDDHMLNLLGGNVENFESLGSLCGYNAALDPYCIDLVDMPRKIMWTTIFDFSMAFDLLKRALIFFSLIFCMLSCLQACEPHAVTFDRLLRALMASNLRSRVVKVKWSG